MKKLLPILGSAVLLGLSSNVEAQVWSQNFNAGIPASWTQIKADNNTISTSLVTSIQTQLATKAYMGWLRAAGDSCALTTSWFTTPAKADRWLITPAFQVTNANMILSWEDLTGDASAPDSVQVLISPTAGNTTAAFTTTLYNRAASDNFTKIGVPLGTYNGQTVRIAFRNNSFDKTVLMLDNIATEIPAAGTDIAVDSVVFPILAANGTQVRAYVRNAGAQTITSTTLTYQVDNGGAISQNFTGLSLLPYQRAVVTFNTGISGVTAGPHTLTVTATQTNGAADPVASNNTKTKSFALPGQSVQRAGLIEEFTSSTCVPCASFNTTFDPLILSNNANVANSNFNIIKYQMNWPNPGTDVSYNNDGLARRAYYGVNSIPDHYTNGKVGGAGNQAEITASKADPAYMSITGSFIVKGDSIIATATVTPNFTITGANTKVHMAIAEKHYTNNGATTTQKEYYHVMRTMLGAGAGQTVTSWTAGTPQTFTYRYKYTVGTVTQLSNLFWSNPFNSNLIIFVQDNASGEIFQSAAVAAQWPTAVKNIAGVEAIKVYPNPATEAAHVTFSLKEATNVALQVTDAVGRVVYTANENYNTTGTQDIVVPTATLSAGVYNVSLRTASGVVTERLSVAK